MEKLSFLDKLISVPKRIFLIDALGALLTSIILFSVLAQLEYYFGMPRNILYLLAAGAFSLFVYSICCYRFVNSKWKLFLGIIMAFNLGYIGVSIFLIFWYIDQITTLGIFYFIVEIIVILMVVTIENKSYSKLA